jgi:hypothetical protein
MLYKYCEARQEEGYFAVHLAKFQFGRLKVLIRLS